MSEVIFKSLMPAIVTYSAFYLGQDNNYMSGEKSFPSPGDYTIKDYLFSCKALETKYNTSDCGITIGLNPITTTSQLIANNKPLAIVYNRVKVIS
ncbi:MAG: hypothetical protein GWP09_00775 [Nitrospiraceae bacterium]|nr:hypothetical protein [Nitrospiraceae bacterium]